MRKIALLAAFLAFIAPATTDRLLAQDNGDRGPPPGKNIFDGDYVTIGAGVAIRPDYAGSDDYEISPLPVILGRFAGIDFAPRGPGLALDIIPDKSRAKVDFSFGPMARARFDRNGSIDDPIVRSLGELDVAVELGASAGVKINRIWAPRDSLSFQVDAGWDIAGAHHGRILSPGITYFRPLGRSVAASISLSADHVDDDYADYYFSVSPAGSAASGLPVFTADSGWKSAGLSTFTAIDLDGNALNGGFSVILIGSYSRLLGDAKRSPVTAIRGDADQWFGTIGLGYTF